MNQPKYKPGQWIVFSTMWYNDIFHVERVKRAAWFNEEHGWCYLFESGYHEYGHRLRIATEEEIAKKKEVCH